MKDLLNSHFVLTICFATMAFLMVSGLYFLEIPKENVNLINVALGVVLGWVSSPINFYLAKLIKGKTMSKKLTDAQIRQIASDNGLEFAMLKAVVEVEAGGSGFILDEKSKSLVPKILFEPHVFLQAFGQ